MRRGEAATLLFLVAFAAFAFIPAWRTTELWGMAVFGWLIAALMVVSPALALTTFVVGRRPRDQRSDSSAEGDGAEGSSTPMNPDADKEAP